MSHYCSSLRWARFIAVGLSAPVPPPKLIAPQVSQAKVQPHNESLNSASSHYKVSTRGSRRIITADADFYCLDGFGLNSELSRCERNDEKPADVGCPLGWQFEDGKCMTTVVRPADRYCNEGYDNVLGRCQRTLQAPKQLSCPPAYRASDYGCIKDVETEPILRCDKGNLSHGTCVSTKQSKAIPNCSAGFEISGEHCARRRLVAAVRICPSGFAEVEGVCVRSSQVPPRLECLAGAEVLDEVCMSRSILEPQYQCHDGSTVMLAQQCSNEVSMAPVEQCPRNSDALGELCLNIELTPPIEGCPAGTQPSGKGCMGGKGLMPFSKECPAGFSFRDKHMCEKRSTSNRESVCPSGWSLKGQICIAVEYSPPQPVCPDGSISDVLGHCIATQAYLPTKKCDKDHTYDESTDQCLRELLATSVPSCTTGTYDPIEDSCVMAEVLPAEARCPMSATTMLDAHGVLLCEEHSATPPDVTCPQDFSLNDSSSPRMCFGRALADGELTCMAPYTDGGDHCTFVEVLPKIIGCVDGGYLKGTSCVSHQHEQPVVMCPESYAYNQETQLCRKLLWSRPTPICPDKMVYDNLVQKCYKFGTETEVTTTPYPLQSQQGPQENLLPLEVQPQPSLKTPSPKVKAKVQSPTLGKEQFIPMQTFTGPDAVQQAENLETIKLINAQSGRSPPQPVNVPPIPS